MAQLRIFLSHSSSDRDFADALAKAPRGPGWTQEAEEAEARAKALGG